MSGAVAAPVECGPAWAPRGGLPIASAARECDDLHRALYAVALAALDVCDDPRVEVRVLCRTCRVSLTIE